MDAATIVNIARRAIKEAARARDAIPSPLRLDEAVLARIPSENIGEIIVEAEERYSTLLQSVESPRWSSAKNTLIIGVDSSSRLIEVPAASIIAASVSVYASRPVKVDGGVLVEGDWPPVYGRPIPGLSEPFFTIIPYSDSYEVDEDYYHVRNPAGYKYNGEYSVYQAMDETRVRLENSALHGLAEMLRNSRLEDDVVVLVDGPIYLVTGALTRQGVPVEYRDAWERLYKDRLDAVEKLEAAGARVFGIVKRIDNALLLSKDPGIASRVEACIGESKFKDKLALHRGLDKPRCRKPIPPTGMHALVTSPLKVEYTGLEGTSKIAQYVVIPQPRWYPNPHASKYYRVEESYKSWQENKGRWKNYRSPAAGLLLDTLARGSTAPVSIMVADRRAKQITSYLRAIMAVEAARSNVPISYSSEIEVHQSWARAEA